MVGVHLGPQAPRFFGKFIELSFIRQSLVLMSSNGDEGKRCDEETGRDREVNRLHDAR
jgi:hypothetical protein